MSYLVDTDVLISAAGGCASVQALIEDFATHVAECKPDVEDVTTGLGHFSWTYLVITLPNE